MDMHEAVDLARAHLHASEFEPRPIEEYRLHRALQYGLCGAVRRIQQTRGEVTRHDVVMLVEAWIIARAGEHIHPLRLKSAPVNEEG